MVTERSTLQTLRLALIATVVTLPLQARATEPAFDCAEDDNIKDCVALSDQARIVELQIISGQLAAPNTISLECGSSEQTPFLAAFYNDTSPPAAVLTRGQDQVVAFVARSGSGARYTADGVEFWEHQGQVSIDWFGTRLACAAEK